MPCDITSSRIINPTYQPIYQPPKNKHKYNHRDRYIHRHNHQNKHTTTPKAAARRGIKYGKLATDEIADLPILNGLFLIAYFPIRFTQKKSRNKNRDRSAKVKMKLSFSHGQASED
jgi:hypothetical protein